MVLDMDGQMLCPGLEWHTLGDSPAGKRSVSLKPKVVMQASCVVALDDKDRLLAAPPFSERLRRLSARALSLVILQ
jgi:hypothetical protein